MNSRQAKKQTGFNWTGLSKMFWDNLVSAFRKCLHWCKQEMH